MKLFDIIGGKVVIHSDALGIPCFKRVWDTDKPDKEHATKVISYIVNPNIPKQLAESILYRLSKEYYLGYRID